jgi:hypothetical protein
MTVSREDAQRARQKAAAGATFHPTRDWQAVPEDAILPPGCQIELDPNDPGWRRARIMPEAAELPEAFTQRFNPALRHDAALRQAWESGDDEELALRMREFGRAPHLAGAIGDRFDDADIELVTRARRAAREQGATGQAKNGGNAHDPAEPEPNGKSSAVDLSKLCLTLVQWAARHIPEVQPIVGQLLTRETRAILSADSGKGKTMLGLALALAAYLGRGFLHWQPGNRCRVLYIDGELPAGAIQKRLAVAASWFGLDAPPDAGLYVLSIMDVPDDARPLDTPEGQAWLDTFIQALGGVDLIIFDNLQALTGGSLKESESWLAMKRWVFGLTAKHIGQLWLHHTGLDTSRAYGDKAREWGMDTVMVGEALETPGNSVSLKIRFTKARNRDPDDPESRAQFEAVNLELRTGQWTSAPAPDPAPSGKQRGTDGTKRGRGRPARSNQQQIALDALHDEAASSKRWDISLADAQALWIRRGAIAGEGSEAAVRGRAFRMRQALAAQKLIRIDGENLRPVGPNG